MCRYDVLYTAAATPQYESIVVIHQL